MAAEGKPSVPGPTEGVPTPAAALAQAGWQVPAQRIMRIELRFVSDLLRFVSDLLQFVRDLLRFVGIYCDCLAILLEFAAAE